MRFVRVGLLVLGMLGAWGALRPAFVGPAHSAVSVHVHAVSHEF
jgi:hypothetical protein